MGMLRIDGKEHHTLGFVPSKSMGAEEDDADSEKASTVCGSTG